MIYLRKYIRSILLEQTNEDLFSNWAQKEEIPPGFNPKIWSLLSGLKDPILEIDMDNRDDGGAIVYDGHEMVAHVLFVKPTHNNTPLKIGDCLGSYHVHWSKTQKPGHGPLAYDLALEWVTLLGSSLVNDRLEISEPARDVWRKYATIRPDVQKKQLDIIGSPLTRTIKDDCVDYVAADDFGYYEAYPDSSRDRYDHFDAQQSHLADGIPIRDLGLQPDNRYLKHIQKESEPFMKAYKKYPFTLIGWAVRNNRMRIGGSFAKEQWATIEWDI